MLFFAGRGKDGRAMRARMRELIQAEPGIHVAELAQRLAVSWHTAAYHLGVLVKTRVVQLEKGDRERRAYPAGISARHRQWLAALRADQAVEVLRNLMEGTPLSVPVLSRRMGFSEKIVRRHVERLADAGLLQRRGELRPVYEANPNLEATDDRPWLERRLGLASLGEGLRPKERPDD